MSITSHANCDMTLWEAAEFIWHEADILDRRDYQAWLNLWQGDGFYIIPINPQSDDYKNELNIAYDNAEMRQMRVARLTGGFAISATPAAKTVRVNSRFVFTTPDDNEHNSQLIHVRSALHLTEDKFGRQRHFCADVEHRLMKTECGIALHDKIVRLINSDGVLTSISYLF